MVIIVIKYKTDYTSIRNECNFCWCPCKTTYLKKYTKCLVLYKTTPLFIIGVAVFFQAVVYDMIYDRELILKIN